MVKDELLRAEKVLADAGVEDADLEARVLFECIYSRSFLTDLLCSRLNREMTEDERSKLESMLARRISGAVSYTHLDVYKRQPLTPRRQTT